MTSLLMKLKTTKKLILYVFIVSSISGLDKEIEEYSLQIAGKINAGQMEDLELDEILDDDDLDWTDDLDLEAVYRLDKIFKIKPGKNFEKVASIGSSKERDIIIVISEKNPFIKKYLYNILYYTHRLYFINTSNEDLIEKLELFKERNHEIEIFFLFEEKYYREFLKKKK